MTPSLTPKERLAELHAKFGQALPDPLHTGYTALDALLEQGNVLPGSVLHLFGGTPRVQSAVLLALCQAGSGRGHGSAYLDVTGTLTGTLRSPSVARAGLLPFVAEDVPGRFEVFGTPTFEAIQNTLEEIVQRSCAPGIVVVNAIDVALQNAVWPEGAGTCINAATLKQVGENLYRWVMRVRGLGLRTNTTLFLAHSPVAHSPVAHSPVAHSPLASLTATPQSVPAVDPALSRTLSGTLHKHALFGLRLGTLQKSRASDDRLRLPVQGLRNYTEVTGRAPALTLTRDGRVCND